MPSRGKGVGDRLIKEILALAEARVEQLHLAVVLTVDVAAPKTNGAEADGEGVWS